MNLTGPSIHYCPLHGPIQQGPMAHGSVMSKWAVRHPVWALVTWIVLLVVIGAAAKATAGKFNDSFVLPGAQSTIAQDLLERLPASSNPHASVTVVWQAKTGSVTDPAIQAAIAPTLGKLAALDATACVAGPYGRNYGTQCPTLHPRSVRQTITNAINTQFTKYTGLPASDIAKIGPLLQQLAPLGRTNPKDLGALAAELPTLAALAKNPSWNWSQWAQVTATQWAKVPGVSPAAAKELADGFALLDSLSKLPQATLSALAKSKSPALQAAAERIPAQVSALERDWASAQSTVASIMAAADAADAAGSQVAADHSIAYATVNLNTNAPSAATVSQIYDIVRTASTSAITVGAQGSILEGAGAEQTNSDAVGLLAAILILLIAFGSIIAAGLPIFVAITGLIGGQLAIVIAAHFMSVATFAPTLAAMIGLGVGIDYALFILNRFRQGLQEGLEPHAAASKAVGTAGRAVLFAGSTVIVALLGMFVLGIGFFNGLAVAAGLAVLLVMASALWFLPALLSLLGTHALGLRLPWARRLKPADPHTSSWNAYGRLLQRAPLIPIIVVLVLIGFLAAPALKMTTGFPDDGTQKVGTPLRTGFDLMAKGFGAGVNGPFFVAIQDSRVNNVQGLGQAITALQSTPGVARTLPTAAMLPLLTYDTSIFGDNGTVTSVIVYPTTDPQSPETAALLTRIRNTTATQLKAAHGVDIYVGGSQAVSTDFTSVLNKALPIFLILVIGLGFIALVLLFHSLVIPLTAAITSLLSFAAALGITVAVFQNGFADTLLGVTGTGPILPFLPLMVFAILFGLSMDYQVFLVSRMKESWEHSHDSSLSVRLGLAGSGRVVVIAASIMTFVFGAFIPTPNDTIKLFGVALASAVVIDAFLVRLILVPSLMSLLGRANWWMPAWLGKVVPTITLD